MRTEHILTSAQGVEIVIGSGTHLLNFSSSNYLGLANHPRVVRAAQDIMDTYGFGMASGRIICGTTDKHKELERRIAAFHKVDDALLYPTGFASNAGFFEAVLGAEDVVVVDENIHASI